ncbi:hypothetical protein P376_0854 [Streptomyces sp. HCCB10043]|nr:hypothetical protein P376_0854 [Streptomyces sp. HCCB10043]
MPGVVRSLEQARDAGHLHTSDELRDSCLGDAEFLAGPMTTGELPSPRPVLRFQSDEPPP